MAIQTDVELKEINYKINRFQSEISKKESFCCLSCPNLIHEIESDLKKLLAYNKRNLSRTQIIAFKKNLKSTKKRWAALSSEIVKEIPDRCVQNVFTDPARVLKKIEQCWPNLAVIGVGAYCSPSFRTGCLAGIAKQVPIKFIQTILKILKIPTGNASKNSEYEKQLKEFGLVNTGLLTPIVEEIIFRQILQKTVGLVPSSVLFGLLHALNPHEGAVTQAVLTTFLGLLYGYLAENYGLEAPIAAHVLNNSLVGLLRNLFSLEE